MREAGWRTGLACPIEVGGLPVRVGDRSVKRASGLELRVYLFRVWGLEGSMVRALTLPLRAGQPHPTLWALPKILKDA